MIYLSIFVFYFISFIFNSMKKKFIQNLDKVIEQSGKWFPKYNFGYLALVYFIGLIPAYLILDYAQSHEPNTFWSSWSEARVNFVMLFLLIAFLVVFLFILLRYESRLTKLGLKVGPYSNFSIFLVIPLFYVMMAEAFNALLIFEYNAYGLGISGMIVFLFVFLLLGYLTFNGFPRWLVRKVEFKNQGVFKNILIQSVLCIAIHEIILSVAYILIEKVL